MNILITGGEGFIGQRIKTILEQQGHYVVTVDLQESATQTLDLSYAVTELTTAIVMHKIDVVCHMAAKVGGGKYLAEEEWDICRHNARVDLNVLEAFLKSRIPRRFVYCSSSMVFQNGFEICVESDVDEYKIPPPTNNYGFTKLQGERFTRALCEKYDREFIIGRPFNVYGPGEHEDIKDGKAHVIPDVFRRLIANKKNLYLYGDGKQTRSFTHADDVARAFAMMCTTLDEECINTTLNIASEENISIKNLAIMIARYLSIDVSQLTITHKPAWAGDTVQRKPDTTKIRQKLGWRPMKPFGIGLKENVDWLYEQRKEG
jgi:nucleoside-diphosphate-sugar epimerase